MFANFLIITWRNLLKNKAYILINIFGMGVAIAQCITGFFAYKYDTTFNSVHENREHVYRVSSVREFEGQLTRYERTPLPLGEIVAKTFPDVQARSRFTTSNSNFKIKDDVFPGNVIYVDPEFFRLFTFEFLAGSANELTDKSSLVVSKEMALRLFGDVHSAYGKTITQVYGLRLREVRIIGVFSNPPMNSSFYYSGEGSAYMNYENAIEEHPALQDDNWAVTTTLFVSIPDPGRLSAVQTQLQPFRENNNKVRDDFQIKEFVLDPFTTMAGRDRSDRVRASTSSAPPISAVIGSNVMGALVLLLACFNLTNTSIAISSRRLKEIGIRKVMGSTRKTLIAHHIGETMLMCLCAGLLGLLLSDFMVRGWNAMWRYFVLTPDYLDGTFITFLVGVLLVAALAAGCYPAFYISKFDPVIILKNKLRFSGTNYFTRTLLLLQLAIAVITITGAIGFMQNAAYQRNYDLGFDVRGSVIAHVNSSNEFETYRNALQENPRIISIAGSKSGIFSNRANDPIRYESKQLDVDIIEVGDNYLKTLGLKLVAGRDFVKDSETDRNESVIITQKLADEFGWKEAIGKGLVLHDTTRLYVVGVLKDVLTVGLWREMEPMMIRYVLPEAYTQMVVATRQEEILGVLDFMKAVWAKLFPSRYFSGRRMDGSMQQVEEVNNNIVYMFGFMGAVTLLLSATGLFTLVSLNIIRRTREIGLRKVLGASVTSIARTVNTEFAIILVLACGLGSWGGKVQADMIMGSIWRYHQGPNVTTFFIGVALLFVVSILSIGYKIYQSATMNPVDSLKVE